MGRYSKGEYKYLIFIGRFSVGLLGGDILFWWVNHKQTSAEEIEGGYIWSPKTNKSGSRNQTYFNLTRTKPGHMVFSYADKRIQAVGLVDRICVDYPRPSDFGQNGLQWNNDGWLVKINWFVIQSPIEPALHIQEIGPLLPSKYSPLQKNGNDNQKCYLASISNELGSLVLSLLAKRNSALLSLIDEARDFLLSDVMERSIRHQKIPETKKEQLIKARTGQGVYRANLERIESKCRITGIRDKQFLVAGHIKPWRVCSNEESIDGNNGFLMSPHIDRLFDRGWITFTDNGELQCANSEIKKVMHQWGLITDANIGRLTSKQKEYLAYHREHIYKG